MTDFLTLPMRELAARIARGEVSIETVVRASIARIEACEPAVRAWQYFDPGLAIAQARRLDAQPSSGPLHGVPIGVKDLMDTADMPTSYGSPIYAGHRPVADAACVAASRAAGAVIMGKTVTTEFATFQPGATRNPRARDAERTPGGSSSGSAAAVASGMVPAAFATQTAGSIIRPAAYCGVVGYKPTFGTLPLAGIKVLAPSLDTVGVLARTVDDAAFFVGALARLPLMPAPGPQASRPLRIGICRTAHWDRASHDARQALADAARLLEQAGAVLSEVALPPACDGLSEAQIRIMGYEAAAAFAPEARARADGFSPAFAGFLESGRAIDGTAYVAAQAMAASARRALEGSFGNVDILLAPSAEGEAPAGLASTGDPIFNRMWSLLGNPCVHVPLRTGASGMPVGVTLIGPRWSDAATLAAAQMLERCAA
ncbi:MAG TPA: amidase [Janthinobacterium sp.]|jgi:amidase|nr:amidase [Janthinobacterium sp.]